jgi:hypothetical protein
MRSLGRLRSPVRPGLPPPAPDRRGDFSIDAIGRIIEHVRVEGTVDGAPFDRPDEVDALTEVFISAFPTVDYGDPAWGDEGLWTQHDAIDMDFPDPTPDQSWKGRTDAATRLAPIAGGSDDIPPEYHPTDADWEEHRRMFDEIDQGDVEPPARNPLGLVSREFAERLAYGRID